MKEDDKIYINQIWHKIKTEESNIKIEKKYSIKKRIKTISLTLIAVLFTTFLVFAPELLDGSSGVVGLIILSYITFSEYKKLKGASYDF